MPERGQRTRQRAEGRAEQQDRLGPAPVQFHDEPPAACVPWRAAVSSTAGATAGPGMGGKRYFEDLEIGEQRESSARVVDKDDMLAFARRYDPQYFHADEEAARGSVFGEVVASGIV